MRLREGFLAFWSTHVQEEGTLNRDQTFHCIFPSVDLEGNKGVYYTSPYLGSYDYLGAKILKTYPSFFANKWDKGYCWDDKARDAFYYALEGRVQSSSWYGGGYGGGYGECICMVPRTRCLYNTDDSYYRSFTDDPHTAIARDPIHEMDIGSRFKVTKGYWALHHKYFTLADAEACLGAYCDPVVHITVHNHSGLDSLFGGFYTLYHNPNLGGVKLQHLPGRRSSYTPPHTLSPSLVRATGSGLKVAADASKVATWPTTGTSWGTAGSWGGTTP